MPRGRPKGSKNKSTIQAAKATVTSTKIARDESLGQKPATKNGMTKTPTALVAELEKAKNEGNPIPVRILSRGADRIKWAYVGTEWYGNTAWVLVKPFSDLKHESAMQTKYVVAPENLRKFDESSPIA